MQIASPSNRRLALATAIAFGSAGVSTGAAKAADLGKSCCADLETRVADLEASAVRSGNRKLEMTISGQVNAGMVWWSDGFTATGTRDHAFFDRNSNVYVVNGSANRTKLDILGTGKIREGLTAGYSLGLRPWGSKMDEVSQVDQNPNQNTVAVESTYVFIEAEAIGKLQLGKQDSVTEEAWAQDLGGSSGTIVGGNPGDWNGGFHLRDSKGRLTDVTWGAVLAESNTTQVPRLAFSSREFSGVHVAASVGGDDTYAAALFYANTFGTVNVAAGVGYDLSRGHDAVESQAAGTNLTHATLAKFVMSGSLFESQSALYASAAFSEAASDISGRHDATNFYGKAGWKRDVTGLGETNIYAEADRTTGLQANSVSANLWGVGITQDIAATDSVLYVGYRHTQLESGIAGANLIDAANTALNGPSGLDPNQHFDAVLAGMAVKF